MKKWMLVLISIILLILDKSFMPFLAIKDAYPSLLFIFAIAYSIINGKKEAVIIGVLSGALQDIFFYSGFGINSLINMLLCVVAAIIGENIYKEKRLIPVITAIILYLIKIFAIGLIFNLLDIKIDIKIGVLTALYSTIIMFLSYKPIYKLYDNDYKKSNWRIR
ncbi:rod shape-determining protein MreD [Clostridium sp.]|uniref:rod shape-determining protein MreD n=1 Tax=Clostridium sp. TaxID=1506 RepID=UPI0026221CA1|nr:rod shape-determining protein MreD [Clostridium sp.]